MRTKRVKKTENLFLKTFPDQSEESDSHPSEKLDEDPQQGLNDT
jgi:hypothetical protein